MARASSSGSPSRPERNFLLGRKLAHPFRARLRTVWPRPRNGAATRPESIRPRSTEFTLIRGANSLARDFNRLCTPARAAEVHTMWGSGCTDSSELTATIAARSLFSSRPGRNALIGKIWLKSFRFQARRAIARRIRIGEGRDAAPDRAFVDEKVDAAPAPLCDFVRKCFDLIAIKHVTRLRRRSCTRCLACPDGRPRRRGGSASAAARSPLSRRSASRPATSRVARPMPELPPVTTATLLVRPRSTIALSHCYRQRPLKPAVGLSRSVDAARRHASQVASGYLPRGFSDRAADLCPPLGAFPNLRGLTSDVNGSDRRIGHIEDRRAPRSWMPAS